MQGISGQEETGQEHKRLRPLFFCQYPTLFHHVLMQGIPLAQKRFACFQVDIAPA